MALHEVIEKHKVSILGQEITYTNKFITYTKGTTRSYKPTSSLISCASRLFKYEFEHAYLTPSLYVDSKGNKYIVPSWQKVHPETTLNDIEVTRPVKKSEIPVEKNTWRFHSESNPEHYYTVRQSGLKMTCDCPGYWRSKIRKCKHILQVENDNK